MGRCSVFGPKSKTPCARCGERKRMTGRSYCRPCHNTYAERLIERNRRYIYRYLLEHPCVDCGISDPILLTFDHAFGKKNIDIWRLRVASIRKINKEIELCEVRCHNCHFLKTSERGGWFRYKAQNGLVDVFDKSDVSNEIREYKTGPRHKHRMREAS